VRLAQELRIPKIIVPEAAGVTCALGLLMADFRHDYSQTFFHPLKDILPESLLSEFIALEKKATAQMVHEGIPEKDIFFSRSANMRYQGQGYELEVPLLEKNYDKNDLLEICNEFGRLHKDAYGYIMSPESAELVNLRLTVIGRLSKPEIKTENYAGKDSNNALKETREVFMEGSYKMVPVYERKLLKFGNIIQAPAIVDQVDSTTVIFDGRASVDKYRNLIIDLKRS
jgi:N-methylhydantoinase A